jgi:hypothetical protein
MKSSRSVQEGYRSDVQQVSRRMEWSGEGVGDQEVVLLTGHTQHTYVHLHHTPQADATTNACGGGVGWGERFCHIYSTPGGGGALKSCSRGGNQNETLVHTQDICGSEW